MAPRFLDNLRTLALNRCSLNHQHAKKWYPSLNGRDSQCYMNSMQNKPMCQEMYCGYKAEEPGSSESFSKLLRGHTVTHSTKSDPHSHHTENLKSTKAFCLFSIFVSTSLGAVLLLRQQNNTENAPLPPRRTLQRLPRLHFVFFQTR